MYQLAWRMELAACGMARGVSIIKRSVMAARQRQQIMASASIMALAESAVVANSAMARKHGMAHGGASAAWRRHQQRGINMAKAASGMLKAAAAPWRRQ